MTTKSCETDNNKNSISSFFQYVNYNIIEILLIPFGIHSTSIWYQNIPLYFSDCNAPWRQNLKIIVVYRDCYEEIVKITRIIAKSQIKFSKTLNFEK